MPPQVIARAPILLAAPPAKPAAVPVVVPVESKASIPAAAPVTVPAKTYKCKYCPFSTSDRGNLVGHYSSVHSWWHKPEKAAAARAAGHAPEEQSPIKTKEEKVIEAYKRGDRSCDIEQDNQVTAGEMYKILHSAGVPVHRKGGVLPATASGVEKKKQQIIEAYKRGDLMVDILTRFHIASAQVYKILHDAKVPLRSKDPNHPASSMKTRRQAKTSAGDSDKGHDKGHKKSLAGSRDKGGDKIPGGKKSDVINPAFDLMFTPALKKLIELSHAEVAYFKKDMDARVAKYGPDSVWDAHCEAAIEYYDGLVKRLNIWITALGDDAGGIAVGLVAFKESIEAIQKLCPEERIERR